MLYNLHRRRLSLPLLKDKADLCVAAGMSSHEARQTIGVIEAERGREVVINDGAVEDDPDADPSAPRTKISGRLTQEELQDELKKRVDMIRKGDGGDGVTDQIRVYEYIIQELSKDGDNYLRLMVQASVRRLAGNGGSGASCWSASPLFVCAGDARARN